MARRRWRLLGALLLSTVDAAVAGFEFNESSGCAAVDRVEMLGALPDAEDPTVANPEALAEFRRFLQATQRAVFSDKAAASFCSAPRAPGRRLREEAELRSGWTSDGYTARRLAENDPKLKELLGMQAISSMTFPYRQGAIVQAFAGMGVSGPSVDGHEPNHTFFDFPVAVASNLTTGNVLMADEGSNKIQTLEKGNPWNVSTLLSGREWQMVAEADRQINITMRTPSAVIQYKGFVYIAEHDNGRIIRIQADVPASPASVHVIANRDGMGGLSGDCGPATLATLRRPQGLAVVPERKSGGAILTVADSGNNRVRSIEITDWPTCIQTSMDCNVPTAQKNFAISNTTGKVCANFCGFNTTSPDMCAFRCRQQGRGAQIASAMLKFPEFDVTMKNDDVKKFLIGCDVPAGDPKAILLKCLDPASQAKFRSDTRKEKRVPANLTFHTLVKDFKSGSTTIKTGERLIGAVVANRLMRLSKAQLNKANWGTKEGKFRFANPSPTLCNQWYWKETSSNADTGQREGTCYMLKSTVTCNAGSGSTGPSACRPGQIKTMIGGGSPGLPVSNSPVGQPYVGDPLDMRLKKPTALLLMNAGLHGELMREDLPPMTLVVSDTANQRLVGMPMGDHLKYHVRFWVFLRGAEVEAKAEQFSRTLLRWSLGATLGWDIRWDPQNITKLVAAYTEASGGVPQPKLAVQATCNVEGDVTPAEHAHFHDQAEIPKDIGRKMCETTVCTDATFARPGFPSAACCKAFCDSAYTTCGLKVAIWGASVTSLEKCNSLTAIEACVKDLTQKEFKSSACPAGKLAPGTVKDRPYLDSTLAAEPGYVDSLLQIGGPCNGITSTNFVGCGGLCDLRIQQILKVNNTWLGQGLPMPPGTATVPVAGLLYDWSTFSASDFRALGDKLNLMKVQEFALSSTPPFVYPASHDAIPGAMMKEFYRVFSYSLVNYLQLVPDSVRVAISSAVHYNTTSVNSFMSDEEVSFGTAYWFAGKFAGTRTGYRTEFNNPTGLALDKAQRLYVTDTNNMRILRLDNMWLESNFSTKAVGTGYSTFNGNGDLATETSLSYPRGLTMDNDGALIFADTKTHDVRQVLGMTWNIPCTLSSSYYQQLSAPVASDVTAAENMLRCRLYAVRAIVLHQVSICHECFKDSSPPNCRGSMFKTLCAKGTPDLSQPELVVGADGENSQSKTKLVPGAASTSLTELLKGLPTCVSEACPTVNGCDLPEASLEWNSTEEYNETADARESPFEMTRLLSDNAIGMSIQAITTLQRYSAQSLSWDGLLGSDMSACISTTGIEALQQAMDKLKTTLCTGSSQEAAKFMAITLFWQWYTYISDVCVEVVDNVQVDRTTLLGAQFYNQMSIMTTRLFWASYDELTNNWSPSVCLRRCDLLHPRFFGNPAFKQIPYKSRYDKNYGGEVERLQKVAGHCCGTENNGLPCGEGEGPCQVNIDCQRGLVCGVKNCLWGQGDNCCTHIEYEQGFERMRDYSNHVGADRLTRIDEVLR